MADGASSDIPQWPSVLHFSPAAFLTYAVARGISSAVAQRSFLSRDLTPAAIMAYTLRQGLGAQMRTGPLPGHVISYTRAYFRGARDYNGPSVLGY